jgi:hypothetical protein
VIVVVAVALVGVGAFAFTVTRDDGGHSQADTQHLLDVQTSVMAGHGLTPDSSSREGLFSLADQLCKANSAVLKAYILQGLRKEQGTRFPLEEGIFRYWCPNRAHLWRAQIELVTGRKGP